MGMRKIGIGIATVCALFCAVTRAVADAPSMSREAWTTLSAEAKVTADGTLLLDGTRAPTYAFYNVETYGDVSLEATYTVKKTNGVMAVGFMIGSTDSETFLRVHYDRWSAILCKNDSDGTRELTRARGKKQEPEKWYSAKVVRRGKTLEVFFNGAKLYDAEVTDTPGLVGFYASQTVATVKDIRISGTHVALAKPWKKAEARRICGVPKDQPHVEILWTRVIAEEKGRQCSWASVAKAKDHSLVAVFSGDRDAHICPFGKVQMVRSNDDGETWSEPCTIGKTKLDDRDAGIVTLPDGRLFVTWFNSVAYRGGLKKSPDSYPPGSTRLKWLEFDRSTTEAEKRANWGYYGVWSSDNGATWTAPEKLVSLRSQTPHGPILLKDGSLMQFGRRFENCLERMFGGNKNQHTTIMVERSVDGGHTWQTLCEEIADATGENDSNKHWMHEPHVAELPGGELYALVRCDRAKDVLMRETRSTDGGKTWSPMKASPLSGLPPHLLVLKDGRLLATYGRRTQTRGGLGEYISASSDGGRTWDFEVKLAAAKNTDLGYPATIELDSGILLTVYYQQPPTGGKPCIMATKWRLRENVQP
ncbi:MAG: exo-alpha-sialidase [Kiritimatiellae bacterium]|nr:exo-alpha-sialidase [Kiritimatiellia bacterium]